MILEGCRWCIGNGDRVRVWTDRWLPCDEDPCVSTDIIAGKEHMRVSDLILNGGTEWEEVLVKATFNARDTNFILSIPFSYGMREDLLMWRFDKKGKYSVRSGYGVLRNRREEGSGTSQVDTFRSLWKVQAPPKVLNLIWRATRECLPVRYNLSRKHITVDNTCPVCNAATETGLHALVSCCVARDVWRRSGLHFFLGGSCTFIDWLSIIFQQVPEHMWNRYFAICWGLWRRRNEVVWNNERGTDYRVVSGSLGLLYSWLRAKEHVRSGTGGNAIGLDKWSKPDYGWLKINVDAAIHGAKGVIAAVMRDCRGHLWAVWLDLTNIRLIHLWWKR